MEEKINTENAKFLYEIADRQLRQLLDNADHIDSKINTLLAACGILVTFFGTLASMNEYRLIGFPGFVGIGAAIIYLLYTHRAFGMYNSPTPGWLLWAIRGDVNFSRIIDKATLLVRNSYEKNKEIEHKKGNQINIATRLIFWGIAGSLIGYLIKVLLL